MNDDGLLTRAWYAIVAFFKSVFGKRVKTEPPKTGPDIDQIAEDFYGNLLDAEKKTSKQ
jgi:hypothetical protein